MSEQGGKRRIAAARHIATIGALAGGLLAAAAPTQAQEPPRERVRREQLDPEQRLEQRVGMLTDRLDLTAAQTEEVRALLRDEAEQMRAVFAEAGIDRDEARPRDRNGENRERPDEAQMKALREAMTEVREQTDAGLELILNAEQLAEYRALEEARRERMEERRPGRGHAHRSRSPRAVCAPIVRALGIVDVAAAIRYRDAVEAARERPQQLLAGIALVNLATGTALRT